MADCTRYKDMISSFADGELSEQEAAEVQRHLDGCPACASLLTAYRSITEAAEESLEEPPPDFAAGIMARIKALSAETTYGIPQRRRRSPRPFVISFIAAAACVALAFIVAPQLFRFWNSDSSLSGTASAPQAAPMEDTAGIARSSESETIDSFRVKNTSDYGADSTQLTSGAPESSPNEGQRGKGDGSPPAGAAPAEPAPSAAHYAIQSDTEENLEKYYAVISIKGLLPAVLTKADMQKNSDGTRSFEITVEKAELLIADGYPAVMGNKNASAALVIYIPEP